MDMHPSLQAAAQHNPTPDPHRTLNLGLIKSDGDTCSGTGAMVRRLNQDGPLEGSWFWFSLLLLLFGPNSGLLSDTLRGYLYNRGMEGWGTNPRKREATTPKSVK